MVNFIILSQQGSGSTMLRSALSSHRNVFCETELFVSPEREEYRYRKPSYWRNDMGRSITDFLDDFFIDTYPFPVTSIGFDLKYNQMNEKIVKYLDTRKIAIIHLIRKNIIKTIISNCINGEKEVPFRISREKFYSLKKTIDGYIKKYENRFNDVLTLYYEDLTDDENIVKLKDRDAKQITNFLKINYEDMTINTEKKLTNDISKLLINYEEIKEWSK